MAIKPIRNNSEKFPRQFKSRNLSRRICFSTNKKLRLSDIDTSNKIEVLSKEKNSLLFDLNILYNKDFDFNEKIVPSKISDVLVNGLCNHFDIKYNSMNIFKDLIVVEERLQHDLYQLEIKSFFKLKKKAKPLFDVFCYFVQASPFMIIDINENTLLNDYTLDVMKELIKDKSTDNRKELKEAVKEYNRNKTFLKTFTTTLTEEQAKQILSSYKPKNDVLKEVKSSLLNWIDTDFSFIFCYPFQFYSNQCFRNKIENIDNEEDEDCDDDYYDFSDFIYFKYSNNQNIESEITDRFNDIFNNYEITTPCWIINKEKEDSNINKSIKAFEFFVNDLLRINELLELI